MTEVVLEVRGIERRFGGLKALSGVDLDVRRGEIHGVIGPNGAGKSTLMNILAGSLRPNAGRVLFRGSDVTRLPANSRARKGIGRTFQTAYTFKTETVEENLRRGFIFKECGLPWDILRRGLAQDRLARSGKAVAEIAEFLGLNSVLQVAAGNLPYGLQKLVGIGVALAARPSLLLMDEPAAGLNPTETHSLGQLIKRFPVELGIDVVLVEHDMKMVMRICDKILVLNFGSPICTDTPEYVKADARVVEAYLGVEYEFA